MLTCIEGVLNEAEVRQFRDHLDNADWQDGAKSAGALARTQKRNQQLDESSDVAVSLGNQLLRKLGSHPL
ncbi:MAG: PKHD-type hydroxylase, partial [Steroidobacter sp.]|nr:PKHD-type hydroxylase [Steroidobacter sp.]